MDNNNYKKLFELLPNEAIQRTESVKTKKGYDTVGYSYQYCVDRFNDVYFDKWGFDWSILDRKDGNYKSGSPFIEITCKVSIWIEDKNNPRSCIGGHVSNNYADALKGAITNGFKKTAAFWGVGSEAYRGTIDDDNIPLPDSHDNKINSNQPEKSFKNNFQGTWKEFDLFCKSNVNVIDETDKKKASEMYALYAEKKLSITALNSAIEYLKNKYLKPVENKLEEAEYNLTQSLKFKSDDNIPF